MGRTSVGTREVRDGSVSRSDIDTSTNGESLITKIVAGADVSLSWTGADQGTGDVTVSFTGGAATSIPLDSYELGDWYGGQTINATPITVDLDGPRFTSSKYSNSAGELTFLEAGQHLVLARITAKITSGTSRSESEMICEEDTGAGWVTIYGTESHLYHRTAVAGGSTGTSFFLFDANVGDKIRMRIKRTVGSSVIQTVDDGSNLIVLSLKGTRGDQGIQGFQGDVGLDGIDGTNGTNGTSGSMIFNGNGTPSNTLGNDTDLYINNLNNEYYQKDSGSWGSPVGTFGSGGGGGVTDHSNLTGLNVDDHLQYHTDARGDARYSLLGHTHAPVINPTLELTLQKLEVLHWMGLT